jgi:hypothetical protein
LILEPDQYRIRENWLYFPQLEMDPIQIPYGLSLSPRPRIRLGDHSRQITSLELEISGSWRKVLPAFCRFMKAGQLRFSIETASADWQRSAARALVARIHYLAPRGTGLILIARVQASRAASAARAKWWRKQSPETRARMGGSVDRATGGLGDVVGAVHLERLMHGHPAGRRAIYEREGMIPPKVPEPGKGEGFRRKVVDDLGLYWISRVAVDGPFQHHGIGAALCDAAREVAAKYMPHPGRYVELIRRMRISEFEDLKDKNNGDFLTGHSGVFGVKLAFSMYVPYLSRRPGHAWNETLGRWEPLLPSATNRRPGGDCLAYYHAKAGPMVISTNNRAAVRKRP